MFGGRGHQSHKRRAGSYPGGFSLLLSPFGGPFSIEHDCLVPVKQHAVLDVPAHSPRQHYFFQITAFLQQVVKRVAMGDADDILLNDRSIIENLRDVMAGSANQLYAARKRFTKSFDRICMYRASTMKSGLCCFNKSRIFCSASHLLSFGTGTVMYGMQ